MSEDKMSSNSKVWDITPTALPLITLIGDPEENFYQLGVKDKQNHSDVLIHIQSQLRILGPSLDYYLHKIFQGALTHKLRRGELFSKLLSSYAEGLEKDVEDVAFGLLVPEILSGLGGVKKFNLAKFAPSLFGCSSFFALSADQRPIHGRILDFPLFGSYNNFERALLCQFKQTPQIFALSAAGLPYPSLTAMNGNGVTLALHQKFNTIFNLNGRSIFEICFELLCEATTLESALRFLRRQNSITAWGINLSFQTGEVLLVDLCGDDLVYKEINLHKSKVAYTNNLPVKYHTSTTNPFPAGITNNSVMRERVALEKLKAVQIKGHSSEEELLKLMGTPMDMRHRDPKDYELSPVTPSSLTIATMRPAAASCSVIADPAPRIFRQNYHSFQNIWTEPSMRDYRIAPPSTKLARTETNNYYQGMNHFICSQTSMDLGDQQAGHHHIQMATQYFEQNKFHERFITQFFFLVYQFLSEKNRKVKFQVLDHFKDLMPNLPPRLSEHCLLFIFRLQTILLKNSEIEQTDFKTDEFKRILKLEQKIPNVLFEHAVKQLIRPRIDLLDIVYLH